MCTGVGRICSLYHQSISLTLVKFDDGGSSFLQNTDACLTESMASYLRQGYSQGSHLIYLISKPCFRPWYVNFSTPPSPSL